MKLSRIGQAIQRKIKTYKYNKEQKFINKHIKIHDNTVPYDCYEKMCEARKTIANYAKHNGVSVDIYDAKREFVEYEEFDNHSIEDYLTDKLLISVRDLKTDNQETLIIPAINDKSPIKQMLVVEKKVVVQDPSEGTERIVTIKSHNEQNFLQYLYHYIAELTKKVKAE